MPTDGATTRRRGPSPTATRRQRSMVLLRLPDLERPQVTPSHETASPPEGPHFQPPPSSVPLPPAPTEASSVSEPTTSSDDSLLEKLGYWGESNVLLWTILAVLALALAAWIQVRTPTPAPSLPSPPSPPTAEQQLPPLHDPRTGDVETGPALGKSESLTLSRSPSNTKTAGVPRARITGMRPLPETDSSRVARSQPDDVDSDDSSLSSKLERAMNHSEKQPVSPTIYR